MFCDEVESIFTFKELEKAPLQEVTPFKPPEEWKLNAFKDAEEQQTFENAMHKIAEKVKFPIPLLSLSLYPTSFSLSLSPSISLSWWIDQSNSLNKIIR